MCSHWRLVCAAYAAMAVAGASLSAWINGGNPWFHRPGWGPFIEPSSAGAQGLGIAIGLLVGLLIVASSRFFVRRFSWGRRLHEDLRSVTHGCSSAALIWMAVLSAVSEELVFRSWLGVWLGLTPQAIIFSLLHQVSGPSRWIWVAWTLVVGLAFGWMFQTTGSLTASVIAHFVVNAMNLHFLRDHPV